MINSIITIAQKEIKDALRDPGSMIAAMLYTVIGPAVVWTVLTVLPGGESGAINKSIDIIGDAPKFISYLEEQDFILDEASPVKLTLPDSIDETIASGKQSNISIEADMSIARSTVGALRGALLSYSNLIIEERLELHGLSPEYISPLKLRVVDTAPTNFVNQSLISLMILSFFMAVAFTGMSLSIDMTAGERERMTLEPLLAQPVTTASIMTGKWAASMIMAMLGSAITAIVLVVIFSLSEAAEAPNSIQFGGFTALKVFIYLIPLCAVFAALQVAVALFARSYKEGMYYLSLSGLGPMIVSFMPDEMLTKFNYLPLFWEAGAIKKTILSNGEIFVLPTGALAVSIIFSAACLYYAQRRLRQEKLLL